jgi:hypothetical protein
MATGSLRKHKVQDIAVWLWIVLLWQGQLLPLATYYLWNSVLKGRTADQLLCDTTVHL